MDVWFLYSKSIVDKKEKTGERKDFISFAKNKYNLDVDILSAHDFSICSSGDGNKIFYKNKEVSVMPKIVVLRKYDIYLARQFELLGVRVVNCSQSMVDARNKMKTYQVLAENNLPIPKTLYITNGMKNKYFSYKEVSEFFSSKVFVLKYTFGSRGKGVHLIHNEEELTKAMEKYKGIVILQEYIENSFGRDIRSYCVGKRCVGAALRVSNGKDFRSNLYQGGKAVAFSYDDVVEDISIRAAEALNLDICGVDLLFTDNGYAICEVNSLPGFKSLNGTTSKNGNEEILKFVRREIDNS